MALVDAGGDGEVYAVAAAIQVTLEEAVDKGDPLGYGTTGWVKACGDVGTGAVHARVVALEAGGALAVISAAPAALVGGDRFTTAPTPGAPVYVKDGATTGLYSETKPDVANGDIKTVIGYSIDLENILIRCTEADLLASGH